ncbi:MAG: hypothetical protein COV44_11160 [Deltaproteobacteria bacterium CG11_big_fil_rev_8_21_14_0_20_45_16]|nr:MAG: hypothetical protein COV44_11160 [Deltaproteobacteria bacterium CG11_big_fil_rev_8_21_14_0_20_45_16]
MIARLKPRLGLAELSASMRFWCQNAVQDFEKAFAKEAGQKFALAFPYGRTGLMLTLKALEFQNKEIICPAYTCVVVAHAIVKSGNRPVFVDCEKDSYNMDLEKAEAAITDNTAAIIATSLFGYPVNLDQLQAINRKHSQVRLIQDCAHSFMAQFNGVEVQKVGTAAIYGLNISKLMTSIFGGMITTDDEEFYRKLKNLRATSLRKSSIGRSFKRFIYLSAVSIAFWNPVYSFVNWLERLGWLKRFVNYYDESAIDMPADYLVIMSPLEARVGLVQLRKLRAIIDDRRRHAKLYIEALQNLKGLKLAPFREGATYSHFVIETETRDSLLQYCIKNGVQLGKLIEYSIPEMKAYVDYSRNPEAFKYAHHYKDRMINLPIWHSDNRSTFKIIDLMKSFKIWEGNKKNEAAPHNK